MIMYVLGRVINPETQKVVRTGLIYISSLPNQSSVYLNGKLHPEKSPTIIRDLPRGIYTIKLFHEGYKPYEKTVTVIEKEAVTLNRILLRPRNRKKEVLSDLAFNKIIPIKGTPLILVSKGKNLKDFFVLKLYQAYEETLHTKSIIASKESAPKPLCSADSFYSKMEVSDIFSVEKSSAFIIQGSLGRQDWFLWFDPKNNDFSPINISSLFPTKPEQIFWDYNDEKNIFALQDGYLNRADINDKALYPKIINNLLGYTIFEKEIYTLLKDLSLKKWDYKGKEQELSTDISSIRKLVNRKKKIKILLENKNSITGFVQNGNLLLNHLPPTAIPGVGGFDWDEKQKNLLIWTKNKIACLKTESAQANSLTVKDPKSLKWLIDGKKNIIQAFWVYKNSHILYLNSDSIYLTEAQIKGTAVESKITDVKKGSKIYYSDITGNAYYLDPETGKVIAIEIIPYLSIIPESISNDSPEHKEKGKDS